MSRGERSIERSIDVGSGGGTTPSTKPGEEAKSGVCEFVQGIAVGIETGIDDETVVGGACVSTTWCA